MTWRAIRRFPWRSIPALLVGLVCLWLVAGVVWVMRPVWLALGRSAVSTFEWQAYATVPSTSYATPASPTLRNRA